MPQQVFISHSKRDEDLLSELRRVFSSANIKAYEASFEDQVPPVSETLKTEINDSQALLLLLGPEADGREVTMIWIGWEAGIALQQGIPVWVLEDVNAQVEMPIPSLTHYLLWDSSNPDQQKTFRNIIKAQIGDSNQTSQVIHRPAQGVAQPLPELVRNAEIGGTPEVSSAPYEIYCPYDSCGERFLIWCGLHEALNCPACRQPIELFEPK